MRDNNWGGMEGSNNSSMSGGLDLTVLPLSPERLATATATAAAAAHGYFSMLGPNVEMTMPMPASRENSSGSLGSSGSSSNGLRSLGSGLDKTQSPAASAKSGSASTGSLEGIDREAGERNEVCKTTSMARFYYRNSLAAASQGSSEIKVGATP